MATSQHPVNSNAYTPHGSGNSLRLVLRTMSNQGGPERGTPSAALVIDSKVCPFFEVGNLLNTVTAMCGNRLPGAKDLSARCLKTLQDVRVEVRYAPHRSFGIGRFSDKPMNEMLTVFQGQKVGMDKFFELKYKIKLRHPELPGVIPNTPRPKDNTLEVFPIEELLVMPGQVVPLEKMSKQLSDKLLKSNSVLPHDRLNKIMRHAESIALFDETNAVLHAFGIQVLRQSNEVVIGVRPCPRLRFANNRLVNANPERSEWARDAMSQSYIDASEVRNWIVLCSQEQERLVQAFIEKLIKLAQRKTMRYSQPIIRTFENNQWQSVFENCVNKNIQFVMLIDSKEIDSHGVLKFLEARYKVLTQQVTLEKVYDVVNNNKNQILENIVNKTNCKNFGLNYVPVMEQCGQPFDLDRGEVLVIGYDVAHPGSVSTAERRLLRANGVMADSLDPSVVGICANMAKHPYSFVGDYFYQESRKEAVDTCQLAERTKWILEQLEKNRPGKGKPKQIFVLRDGLSEGQLKMFLFVIGTKRHFKKFFAVRNGRVENLAPGSVISEKMVREDCPEFFMQSHYPLKGVGKAVEYSVPVNEMDMSMDQLQAFLNALCYDHQIVNSAISLPEPIYQADELAKRGHNNFLVMKKSDPSNIPRFPTRVVDFRALTEMLSYKNSLLSSTRFSA
uniref:Piwi domain-containing protein n=1 Tax=Ditylenchus dipsaci TaxID=166011 RepID=A0A915DY74_9BILA